ncbi:MAG: hypothetical protein A2909_00720 [Candidatus Tagabacteria bacterium RIFCSPLOWO2_01_FULL_39_11]|uniref:Proline dehydrogenase domain-containing protein n=1 Tax=Candidatus Tagabacteria bacterium RIFCSPLOWO2_01_FULL_39_11 TaxID=1802295 RepID=A0A1G2LRW2_9BACT|nr:MAG: hypothetical protein A2909_00720 [Candidatus Tagabacteria bacterium RIFCSPLOWO2_01_FULL_39_11]
MLKFLMDKFIAGNTPEKALETAKSLINEGFMVDLNILGENEEYPESAFKKYYELINLMKEKEIYADISLKLSHFGVSKNLHLVKPAILHLAEELKSIGKKVTIDMEDADADFFIYKIMSYLTKNEITNAGMALALNRKGIHKPFYNYGKFEENRNFITIDCYNNSNHYLMQYPFCAIHRICKGAKYKSQKKNLSIAKNETEIYAKYICFFKEFILKKTYAGFAVARDFNLIRKIQSIAGKNEIRKSAFEFQMLYGIRMDIAKWILKNGYKVKIYLPFLYNEPYKKAIPYFLRRCGFKIIRAIITEKIFPAI